MRPPDEACEGPPPQGAGPGPQAPDPGGANPAAAGFGLYVHWPFCLSKCPYCDFNSHIHDSIDMEEWKHAFIAALRWFAARTGPRRVGSVFFGGGTPSLMAPGLVAAILDEAACLWAFSDDVEITLEANPTSAEAQNFRAFADAGVNRLSLGIQALDDEALKALGRRHTAAQALHAWEMAQEAFPRASFDLIYARPGQTPAQWEEELARALCLGARHISAYQLTMEPETPFHKRYEAGKLELPDDDTSIALYEIAGRMMAAAGLESYEISNYATCGEECRHNLLYWRYGEYAGIGPGAHGRLVGQDGARLATEAWRSPARWLAAAAEGGLCAARPVSRRKAGLEYLLMALRTREGLSLARLQRLSGICLREERRGQLAALCSAGLLHLEGNALRLTEKGLPLADYCLAQLAF